MMTQLTRRAFLAQALLLPVAAVLPALPEVEVAPQVIKLTAHLDTTAFEAGMAAYLQETTFLQQQVSLLELMKTHNLNPARIFDGMRMGLNANVNDLLHSGELKARIFDDYLQEALGVS